jgi:hypothetical protein
MNPTELPLRDIHLLAGAWFLWRRLRRQTVKKLAIAELQKIRAQAALQTDQEQLQALSSWLRRVGMSLTDRQQVASLTGEAWLEFLDQGLAGQPFSQGAGRLLIEGIYRQRLETDVEPLYELCQQWLDAQTERVIGART